MGKMKKSLLLILPTIVLLGLLGVLFFYWKNIKGLSPSLRQPPTDITEIVNTPAMPLRIPPGFSLSIFAKNLGKARVMVEDPAGNLLVSIISQGRVVALPDRNHDGIADEITTVAEGLNSPHGLAFRCGITCKLYIAETDQVAVYDYDQLNLAASNKKKIIDLPDDGGHFTRTIMFISTSDQDKLLTSVGSSSNVAYEKDWRRAKILISNTDGSDLKTFATGLRNSVFMTIHPLTGQIWATEMGRDYLGDNLPPDEVNIIQQDKDYGWPNCYGKNIHDADFDKNTNPCIEPFKTASYIDIPAHSAPLGLSFFTEKGWPEEYWYNLLVAYHGSWNRTVPTGYKIVRYKLDKKGNYLGKEDFITGWLTEKKRALGRPVDILIRPGVIFISDDKAGLVYKLNLINSSLN